MGIKVKCEKHGFLEPYERATWSKQFGNRWCIYCLNEMMDKHCGKLIEVKEDEGKSSDV